MWRQTPGSMTWLHNWISSDPGQVSETLCAVSTDMMAFILQLGLEATEFARVKVLQPNLTLF